VTGRFITHLLYEAIQVGTRRPGANGSAIDPYGIAGSGKRSIETRIALAPE